MGWSGGVSTGIIVIDYFLRPVLKVMLKFPLVGLSCLCLVYGLIGYHALKSAYLADR